MSSYHAPSTPDLFDLPASSESQVPASPGGSEQGQSHTRVPQISRGEDERDRFLRDVAVAERYGVSRQTVWRWVKHLDGFPNPIHLSPGTSRWRLSELLQFEAGRLEQSKPAAIRS